MGKEMELVSNLKNRQTPSSYQATRKAEIPTWNTFSRKD